MDYLNAKAMYATALKAPTAAEVSHNKAKAFALERYNQSHDPDVTLRPLRPEMIHSFEGNLTFSMNTIYAAGTYFFTIVDNAIQFQKWYQAINMDYYMNSGHNAFSSGGELEVRYAPADFLRLWASCSYTRTWGHYGVGNFLPGTTVALKRDTTVENVSEDIPSGKTYLGVNYRAPFGLSSFVVLKGVWAQVRADDVRNGPGADFDPGYWLVDLQFQQPIGRYFTLQAGVANVLNTQYYFGTGDNHGEIPGANRMFSLGVKAEM
jgi:outer membrane receptor protein involved in Fe transport